MKVVKCKNYDEMSAIAANVVAAQITLKSNCVLGLPTGGTPVGMYKVLSEKNQAGEISFADVTTFNLDEYFPIKRDNDQSYYYFMNKNLYSHVNLKAENINIPNGEAVDAKAEGERYDAKIESMGGIDLQVLGIGPNGHIGFNEPDDSLVAATHKTGLTEETIIANSRFFEKEEDVPKTAITLGLSNIMKAKRIIMLVSGKNKHKALNEIFAGKIDCKNPSTMLLMHPDVTIIADEDALNG